ncbi:MAG: glycosyltransferase family 39 protein [Candidatus Microsaccharimonas sp.]
MKKNRVVSVFWWPAVIAAAVFVFAAAMVFSIGQSIWFDEGYSILLAKNSWSELFALTAVDAHPPFYYALLKVWGSVFGFDEFALRSLSATLLSGTVVMVSLLLRRLFSARVALLALPVIILGPFLLRYGYEVRMYSTALLIGVSATYMLVVALKEKRWWQWGIYAVLVALGMYTLYMMVVVWLAHFVWLLVQSLKKPRNKVTQWQWVYAYAAAVALFAAYIPTFLYQMTNSALPGIGSAITLTRLSDITSVLLTFTPEWKLGGLLSLLILAGIALLIWVGVQTHKHLTKIEKKHYGFLAVLVLVPLAFYTITSLSSHPIFVNRYLAHVAIFIYALVGVTLALGIVYQKKFKKLSYIPYLAYGVILVTLSIGLVQLQAAGNYIFERNQTPYTQQIRDSIKCSDALTIVADDPYTYIDSVYYFDNCDIRFFSENDVEKKGGYAPLHGSPARVGNQSELTAPIIMTLGWDGKEPSFELDERYKFVDEKVFGSQLITTYRLIEE